MTDTSGHDVEPPGGLVSAPGPLPVGRSDVDHQMADHQMQELKDRLVAALEQIPTITSAQDRGLLKDLLEERLASLGLRDNARARAFFAETVLRCSQRTGGLAVLASCVELMAGTDPVCQEARRLVEQLDALSIEPGLAQVWMPLRRSLLAIALADVQPLLLQVTDGRAAVRPPHCRDTWSVFVHLVGQNGPPGNPLPPWMTFLEVVRARLDDASARLVREFVRTLASRWDCTAALETVRARHEAQTPRPAKSGILTIVATPDLADVDAFSLHSLQRWDDDASAPVRSEDRAVRREELMEEVERIVLLAEQAWAARAADLKIEFVLPLTLINEPVEWYPKDSHTPPPSTLALYHTVVVRSFERLRQSAWHRVWLRRWERLHAPLPGQVMWSRDPHREDHVRRLEAELRANEDYVALVLSAPPSADPADAQEIMVALRAGIPLILWHRTGLDTQEVHQAVAGLLTSLRTVPETTAQVRRQIEALSPAARQAHPAREVSVLWDNAHRGPTFVSEPQR